MSQLNNKNQYTQTRHSLRMDTTSTTTRKNTQTTTMTTITTTIITTKRMRMGMRRKTALLSCRGKRTELKNVYR